jgi:hypothetical protein
MRFPFLSPAGLVAFIAECCVLSLVFSLLIAQVLAASSRATDRLNADLDDAAWSFIETHDWVVED